ncbi:MAG TPA: hypothetical protein PKD83_02105 [Ignavibacteria bacterium]|nr:hypothetical protein [Ignavibacteria bacterium]
MTEFKSITGLTETEFSQYRVLLKNIFNKFGNDALIQDGDWFEFRDFYNYNERDISDFKKSRLSFSNNSKHSFKEYVIFENEKPEGWIAFKVYDNKCEFMCELISDEINENIFRKLLILSSQYMEETNFECISYWTHNERKDSVCKKFGLEPGYTMHISKLSRDDMKLEYWREIVKSNKEAENFKLVFCHEIPEENYEEYVRFKNEINRDLKKSNPNGSMIPESTIDTLKERIQRDRDGDDPYYNYILFNGNEIAAYNSVYVEISEKTVLNHNGALTAVNQKYRGKNLAKYLKAKMYLKVLEDFKNIDAFYTDTYPENTYMYRINEELGFKQFRKEKNYIISKEFIKTLKNIDS